VSLFGVFGPDAISAPGRSATSLFGTRVLFNGIPALLTYVSPTQIDAVVPATVAGNSVAMVEIDMAGIRSPVWGVPVLPRAHSNPR
jgi:uncharacterized protein (TIGR03437 family)